MRVDYMCLNIKLNFRLLVFRSVLALLSGESPLAAYRLLSAEQL